MSNSQTSIPSLFFSNKTGTLRNRVNKSIIHDEDDTARSWDTNELRLSLGEIYMPGLGEVRDHLHRFKFAFESPQELLIFLFPAILALWVVFCYWMYRGSAEEFVDLLETTDDVLGVLKTGMIAISTTLLEWMAMLYGAILFGGKLRDAFLESDLVIASKTDRQSTEVTVNRLRIDAGFDDACQTTLYRYAKQDTVLP